MSSDNEAVDVPNETPNDAVSNETSDEANDTASENEAVTESGSENGNDEANVSDSPVESIPDSATETQEDTISESDSTDTQNQENEVNTLPSDNSDTQANGEAVEEATTSASSIDDGDSSVDDSNGSEPNGSESNGDNAAETDSNSTTESTDDSAATNAPETTPESSASESSAPITDAPESTPEFTCQSVGRFPYPGSCDKYYYCWDTVHSYAVFSCPKVFDPVSTLCVNNYAVCPLAPTCEADKQIFPDPDDKTAFFECKLERNRDALTPVYEIRREECERGREFDAELGYCRLNTPTEGTSSESGSSERFECTSVGIFIDYTSETHYIECVVKSVCKGQLKAVRRKCPKYTVFSAADKQCIPLWKSATAIKV